MKKIFREPILYRILDLPIKNGVKDPNFTRKLKSELVVGDEVYFKTFWVGTFGEDFPVRYYIDHCRMFDSIYKHGKFYDLIKDAGIEKA